MVFGSSNFLFYFLISCDLYFDGMIAIFERYDLQARSIFFFFNF